jgi:hypothetical protein
MHKYVWFKKPNVVSEMITFSERIMLDEKLAVTLLLLGRDNGNEVLMIISPSIHGATCDTAPLHLPPEYGQPGKSFRRGRANKAKGWVDLCDKS